MKKIATITYHSAYNYGANLQAYALQEFVKKLDKECRYDIINLRTKTQKELYKTPFEKKGIKNIVKRILLLSKKRELIDKNKKFEDFINQKLNLTKECSCMEDIIRNINKYEYYISGSDQIWNIKLPDFDYSYYLEFVENAKKISYAASFGSKEHKWTEEEEERVRKDLKSYNAISAREKKSYDQIKRIINDDEKDISINIDPTMLLDMEEWESIIDNDSLIKGKYIFYYDVKDTKENAILAKKIGKVLKERVVISRYQGIHSYFQKFYKKFNTGPIEFLNLIKNADVIITSSFHGAVFSILFNKPFVVIDGKKDNRINDLLLNMGFENKSVDFENYKEVCKDIYNISFEKSEEYLKNERQKSREYLKNNLEIL